MPASFCYRCKKCDQVVEFDRVLADNTRHMTSEKKVCGTLRRDYKAENVGVHTASLRRSR